MTLPARKIAEYLHPSVITVSVRDASGAACFQADRTQIEALIAANTVVGVARGKRLRYVQLLVPPDVAFRALGEGGRSPGKLERWRFTYREDLGAAKANMNSDELFWLDPWSAQGQEVSLKLLPQAHDLRLHAERAIVLLAQARAGNPKLAEPEALTAMDLGARRLDFIGLKFQLAQEIAAAYAQAVAQQHDKTQRAADSHGLEEISSDNGRCQDLRDGYSALKAEYSQVWLGENRPYWLNNVTVRYDLEIERWQRRGNQFETAVRAWHGGQDLPAASSLGLPAAADAAHN